MTERPLVAETNAPVSPWLDIESVIDPAYEPASAPLQVIFAARLAIERRLA